MKQCSKCKEWKEEEEYRKNKMAKDGFYAWCAQCSSNYDKKYRVENLEKITKREKKYRVENPEKIKETKKKYRQSNLEKEKEYAKVYREKNTEKLKEKFKKKYWENVNNTVYKERKKIGDMKYRKTEKGISTKKKNRRLYQETGRCLLMNRKWRLTDSGIISSIKVDLRKRLNITDAPQELIECKLLIIKTKRLCKTSKN